MADFLKVETLALFLLFVVPGFVALKIFDLIVPSDRRNFGIALIEAISYSMINWALFFWAVVEVNNPVFRGGHPIIYYLVMSCLLFVTPCGLAILTRTLLTSRLLGGIFLHPTPTSWDYFFGKREPCWMLFHLKSGKKLGGFYGGKSFASSFPYARDIYVEEAWRVNKDAQFTEQVDRSLGALIRQEEVELIEIFAIQEK